MKESDYTNSIYYHRDLSWLLFNRRVIQEASDGASPLLERFRFLAIGSSNLDEFFMIRVPGIQSKARLKQKKRDTNTQWHQEEVLDKLFAINSENVALQYTLFEQLQNELKKEGYCFKSYSKLSEEERKFADDYFKRLILPSLTTVGLDAYRAFPKLTEKSIHLFVHVSNDGKDEVAIIPLPPLFPRVIRLLETNNYLFIEELISQNLEKIFVDWHVDHFFFFRITYDKDLELEEVLEENFYVQMEEYIVERNKGLPSRLEVSGSSNHQQAESIVFLCKLLGLEARDVYQIDGPLDLTFLFSFVSEIGEKSEKFFYESFTPEAPRQLLGESLYSEMRQRDILLQHPYDSYDPVVSFLEFAAKDPKTISIKQTLYRVAEHSKIVRALKDAAANGKQVTVLVELRARFDEENNLHWAQELEEAGCFVIYGFPQLKTHCKAILVTRKEQNNIQQYVHVGTGNYNEKTAKTYTDISHFSTRNEIAEDITELFSYLSGYRSEPSYKELVVSPENIRHLLVNQITKAASEAKKGKPSAIFFKVNALTDKVIIDKLYEASQAGVKIQLLIRGACCLRPGITDLSENIEVRSIVGRYLEHSRIYGFYYEEGPQVWLSSADAMVRNMTLRVEIASPIVGQEPLAAIEHIKEVFLKDEKKAYFLHKDGEFKHKKDGDNFSAQETFLKEARKVQAEMEESTQTNAPVKNRLFHQLKEKWFKKTTKKK